SKRLSSILTVSTCSTSQRIACKVFSVPLLGLRFGLDARERFGSGRALRSTLPFGFRGNDSSIITADGIMYAGRTAANARFRLSTSQLCSSLGERYATSLFALPSP